jgi:hypothetical protein
MRKLRYKHITTTMRRREKLNLRSKSIPTNTKLIVKCNNAENHKVFIVMRHREGSTHTHSETAMKSAH